MFEPSVVLSHGPADLTRAATDLDSVTMSLPAGADVVVKVMVAVFLFGVALDTPFSALVQHFRRPWILAAGVAGQFLLLPLLTLGLCLALDVRGSVAIGMLLISCLPAGNLSNLLTHRARGDVSLSIAMTSVSNLVALVATPALFAFWAGQYEPAQVLLRRINLDPVQMAFEIALLIGVPFLLGMGVGSAWPKVAQRVRRPIDIAILVLLLFVVLGGIASRWNVIITYVDEIVLAVVLQNVMVLLAGWLLAKALRLRAAGVRAMTLEMGVRNTALGLVIALAYFSELGGVVLVAAIWGLWDVASGLTLATFWRRRPIVDPVLESVDAVV